MGDPHDRIQRLQLTAGAMGHIAGRGARGLRRWVAVEVCALPTLDLSALLREDPTFQQKTGEPPPPEEWPAPRPVKDFGKGKGASKGKDARLPAAPRG